MMNEKNEIVLEQNSVENEIKVLKETVKILEKKIDEFTEVSKATNKKYDEAILDNDNNTWAIYERVVKKNNYIGLVISVILCFVLLAVTKYLLIYGDLASIIVSLAFLIASITRLLIYTVYDFVDLILVLKRRMKKNQKEENA